MPEFRHRTEVTVDRQGEGWSAATLADARHVPGMPMVARRWRVDHGARTPLQEHEAESERFLYVIAGDGRVQVDDEVFELEREDVVWLEPGESYVLEAGASPLEVLEALSD